MGSERISYPWRLQLSFACDLGFFMQALTVWKTGQSVYLLHLLAGMSMGAFAFLEQL